MTTERDLQKVTEQEAALIFPHFDPDMAWRLGEALRDAAKARGVSVLIDIRRGDNIAFFYAMEGTGPSNADWARRKRNTVELARRSSYGVFLQYQAAGGPNFLEKLGLPPRDYAAHGGSFPIVVAGAGHIGSVTVSALPQRDDHGLIVEVLATLLGHDPKALALD